MNSDIFKKSLLFLSLAAIPIFAVVFWRALDTESTLPIFAEKAEKAGVVMLEDLRSLPVKEIKEEEESYIIEEDGKDGIDISFASSADPASSSVIPAKAGIQEKTTLSLPKDYGKPIEVRLDDQRVVLITDLNGSGDYEAGILDDESPSSRGSEATAAIQEKSIAKDWIATLFRQNGTARNDEPGSSVSRYLTYTSPDERKTHLYAYQKDQSTGEKKLKSWTLYQYGLGKETESYKIENAKIKIDDDGNADVFFFGQSDSQSEQAKADVDPNLMDRAQKFLQQETGNDIMNDTDQTPGFTIPKPKYFTKDGAEKESDWTWDETTKTLSVALTENPDQYPIALDPTLAFTAPGSTSGGDAITGEGGSFGGAMVAGDFNADGRMDLAVPASGYSTNTGRVYIFYNDGMLSVDARSADAVIQGAATGDYFGSRVVAGDFNTDGKTDLVVGAPGYSANTGRVYIFYNDGSYPTTVGGADIIISGETTGNYFASLVAGDFNADGKADLAVGATNYSSNIGRAYIFYGGSIITENASGADIIIQGETAGDFFGLGLSAGDFNQDGKTDLAVGAYAKNSNTGRAYIFYNGSIITENASGADIIITGETTNNSFGYALAAGDFNADGKTDLAAGAYGYSSDTGRTYIFYGGSIITEAASGADVIIQGEAGSNYLGYALVSGDFNSDGKTDLASGAYGYSSTTGRTYVFYNDGSYPTAAASADVIITGETTSNQFGGGLAAGDFNQDGKTDLVASSRLYASNTGKAYIFYSQNGQINTNKSIAGETTSNNFGTAFAAGDFNADGRVDLAVGASGYSTNTGRVYIFYNNGSYPSAASTADVIITGTSATSYFGGMLVAGDLNADGRTDLVVSRSGAGYVHIFYNDGSYPALSSSADVSISGFDPIGSMATGDFNADGRTDLALSELWTPAGAANGSAYIFYNDGSIPTTGATADVIIQGEAAGDNFGKSLAAGDFNADGKTDLAVGSPNYSSSSGRAYIFYNDGSYPAGAASADIITTGEASSNFGYTLAVGDFNADGRVDLAVGAIRYSSWVGRAYVFYNDGSYPTTAATADIVIQGLAGADFFGQALVVGDFNADGKTDLAVGASGVTTNTGKAYIFHNDGSYPTTAATADVTIAGETTSNYFGATLVSGDFNADGRTDLVVGAYGNTTNTGKVYFYETRENFAWQVQPVSGLRTSPSFAGQEMKITGESGTTGKFGGVFATGDFNADGKIDLAVGASEYNSNTGRVYLFYNDGSITPGAASADVIITGEATSNYFGTSVSSGDWNADGKTDLAVGAFGFSSYAGRTYLFYQDGSYPTGAASADVIITGEANSYFGMTLTIGDFNTDGEADFAVSAYSYSSATGRTYLFYQDGSYPTGAASADVIIQGEASFDYFGASLVAGDFNTDGKIDLAVGAHGYPSFSSAGRTYLFYQDGSYPTGAASADVIITGEANYDYFGTSLAAGDLNADGKTDLAVGAYGSSTNAGRAYIFYNGSIVTENASGADVRITGELNSQFGRSFAVGDFNGDGKADLAVSSYLYSTSTGRTYLFYNDGSYVTTAVTADLILTGEATSNSYGAALAAGDFNTDGKTDLIVGAYGYASNKGRAYLYAFNDGVITGENTSDYFGYAFGTGDWNADGRIDLAASATGYSASAGRAYIFWGDNLPYPTGAASADVIIQGEASSSFGSAFSSGDFNQDGKMDLVVGAKTYNSNAGRAYIFYNGSIITEAAAGADFIITGEADSRFGHSIGVGDLNVDGKIDLVIGAGKYPSDDVGRVYIFYNDGSIATTAITADVIIQGETWGNFFGHSIVAGDFNQDGKADLVVVASLFTSYAGRIYIFYADGTNNFGTVTCSGTPSVCTAGNADLIITGESNSWFASSLVAGDFNADGNIDLAAGAYGYSTNAGRAYIFYNDGSIPTTAATADVIITDLSTYQFGKSLAAGDFNADGRIDFFVGADNGGANAIGRAYLFYNDGAYPSTAAAADSIVSGQNTLTYFGSNLISGDFSSDGKTDLVVGTAPYATNTGRVYVIISEARSAPEDQALKIKGGFKTKGGFRVR